MAAAAGAGGFGAGWLLTGARTAAAKSRVARKAIGD